ncbi:hypothetical protein HELRODRAFT_181227 [Helobdella robusta]|uniref:Uncharacterized protein n=1 Tax=Helobdella robusta TaxID=6412 RepID=T1FGS1_HELRO|nr:hypothetical protein HELRODRAFT_181227 [Helobdella robusta]ESN93131.1 hypothetical protein HELRODRAFT_181227 [Helobdella robusta]
MNRRFDQQAIESKEMAAAMKLLACEIAIHGYAPAKSIKAPTFNGSALKVLPFIPAKDRDNFEILTDANKGNYSTSTRLRETDPASAGAQEFRNKTATKAFIQALRYPDMRYDFTLSKIKEILEQHIKKYCKRPKRSNAYRRNETEKTDFRKDAASSMFGTFEANTSENKLKPILRNQSWLERKKGFEQYYSCLKTASRDQDDLWEQLDLFLDEICQWT